MATSINASTITYMDFIIYFDIFKPIQSFSVKLEGSEHVVIFWHPEIAL